MRRSRKIFFDKSYPTAIIRNRRLIPFSFPSMVSLRSLLLAGLLIVTPSAFAASGDYAEISCSTQSFFGTNSCNQCFDGGNIAAGQKLTGLYDTWTNKNQSEQVIYEDEQVKPTLVNLGGSGTTFVSNPADPEKFWKFGTEIIFTKESSSTSTGTGTATGSTSKNVYSLKPSKTVRIYDSEFGAYYAMEKTSKKNGEFVALMKFPTNYRDVNDATGKPGLLQKHNECVAYKASVAAAPAPAAVTPPPTTKVKTGAADTFLFLGLAMLLGLAFMFAKRRSTN